MSEAMEEFLARLESLQVPWQLRQDRYIRTPGRGKAARNICPVVAVGRTIDAKFPNVVFISKAMELIGLQQQEVIDIMIAADQPEQSALRQRLLQATRLASQPAS